MKKKWYFDLRMKQKNDPRRWALTKTIWRKGDWKILRYFRDMNSCLPETSWHYCNLRYEVTCWERGEFKWVILPRKHFDLSTAKFQSRRSVNIFTAIYLIAAYQQGLFPILWQLFAVFETTCFVVGRSALLCLWKTLFSYSVLLVTCFTVCLASLTRCHLGTALDSVWPSLLKRHLPVGCLNVSVAAHGYTIWKNASRINNTSCCTNLHLNCIIFWIKTMNSS